MKPLRLFFCLCLLLPLAALAQKGGTPPPEPLRVRFLFLDESPGAYAVKTGARLHDLGASPYAISAPVALPPGAGIELHKLLPDPATGTPIQTRVLQQEPPAGLTHALAVVLPVPATTAGASPTYRVRFYDIDPEKTPPRSIRVLNLSPLPMAARFGETQIEIAPGGQQLVRPSFDRRNRVRSFVASRAGAEWRMIFNSFLSLQDDVRMTGIMIHSASGMIHTYTEAELAAYGRPQPGCFWLTFSDSL